MIYIGVAGKVNKFRTLSSWLLGSFIEDMIRCNTKDVDLKDLYNKLIEQYKEEGMSCVGSSNITVLESFGRYIIDQMKMLVGGTFDLEIDAYSKLKDYKIDLNTFEVSKNTDLNDNEISLKDFTIRFGESLKKTFGEDVWVKSVNSWVKMRDSDCKIVIYTDVKTNCEIDHVKNLNGVIVEVSCIDDIDDDYNKIKDRKIDYKINVNLSLNNLFEDEQYYKQLYKLAQTIYASRTN